MDADRRVGFKARLQRKRAALLRQAAATSVNGSLAARRELGTPGAPCDRSRSTPTDGRTRQSLEEIDAGLARLAADAYGICTTCGREIALDRLDLVPATRYCLRCATLGRLVAEAAGAEIDPAGRSGEMARNAKPPPERRTTVH